MANTFKVITKAGVTSEDVIYTVAGSTTAVILGLVLGNTTGSQITGTVTLSSDTANRAGANNEANQDVELVTNAAIPAGSSLSVLDGKVVKYNFSVSCNYNGNSMCCIAISYTAIKHRKNGV